jgi:hypothetical protein
MLVQFVFRGEAKKLLKAEKLRIARKSRKGVGSDYIRYLL